VAIAAIFALAIVLISPNNDRPNVQVQDTKQLPVVFTLKVPGASSVAVIGTFNQWNAKGFEMKGDKERGVWSITLSLPQGRHEYAFLVDGKKVITDPQAAFYEEDGFGSQNSVLVLRGENGQNT
jgi:1,4-alpha-glucan branching enzyme